jgi:ornithine cyclodeaminase/alanine dehydrogenase-like protein (mu-crystallin family)
VTVAPVVFGDDDVRAGLGAGAAVAAMRQALVDRERGVLRAPPRVSVDLGEGRLVFTSGAHRGRWFGYRSYDTFEAVPGAQVVVVHDWQSGRVLAIAVGNELGPRRTGATGGLAVDVLARSGAARVGLIGTGIQAWAQLWAIAAVRRLSEVVVWSRDGERRAAFVRRAREELNLNAQEATSAEDAVGDRDIVVLATNSARPVIDPAWIAPGCHVTTLGPKQQGRAEFDVALAERSDVIVTDSLAQAHAYQPPFVLDGTAQMQRLASLGSVLEGTSPGRSHPQQVTLFCSVGLAGTEVHLLAAVASSTADGAPKS